MLAPDDETPDYFSLVRFENGKPVVYILVDNDLIGKHPTLCAFRQSKAGGLIVADATQQELETGTLATRIVFRTN